MSKFHYISYKEVSSVEETKQAMLELGEELRDTDMQNLRAFNQTYYIITKNVYQRIGNGHFDDDWLMEQTDVVFATYYFQALKNYLSNKPCPPAWRLLFEQCRENNSFQFVYMAMGVNAHVNNDLPQTLINVLQGSREAEDYFKVDAIIEHSLTEVIASLDEESLVIATAKDTLKPFYTTLLTSLIQFWRKDAWNTYDGIIKKNTTLPMIEQKAEKIAAKLTTVTTLTEIPSLLTLFLNPLQK